MFFLCVCQRVREKEKENKRKQYRWASFRLGPPAMNNNLKRQFTRILRRFAMDGERIFGRLWLSSNRHLSDQPQTDYYPVNSVDSFYQPGANELVETLDNYSTLMYNFEPASQSMSCTTIKLQANFRQPPSLRWQWDAIILTTYSGVPSVPIGSVEIPAASGRNNCRQLDLLLYRSPIAVIANLWS